VKIRILASLTLALVPLVHGCNIYACTYETRFVMTSGTVVANGATVTAEYVNFRQYRPDQSIPIGIPYRASGEGLSAAPTSLTLIDDRDATRTVAALSFQSASSQSFVAASEFTFAASEQDAMFAFLASGHAQMVLRLANGSSIVVPLAVKTLDNWHRPNCD